MQILEQLAFGQNVSTMDVVSECSAVIGYLECMNEYTTSDMIESVVMEGFDPKAFLKKVWDFIKGMLQKINQMINKLIGFLRSRKGKLKRKEVSDLGSGDNSEANKSNSPARIGMKSKDELIKEVFEKHPYSGINPEVINSSFSDVSHFVSVTLASGIFIAGAVVSYANRIISADFNSERSRERYNTYLKFDLELGLKSAIDIEDDGPNALIDKMLNDVCDDKMVFLNGKLESPQDFKKAPMIIYEHHRKDYSNTVFKYDEFKSIVETYNSTIDANSKYSESILKKLDDNQKLISEYVEKCNNVTRSLDKIPGFDQNYLMKAFTAINNMLNTVSQFVAYTSMGIPEFCSRVDSDLNRVGAYIDNVNAKLKSI